MAIDRVTVDPAGMGGVPTGVRLLLDANLSLTDNLAAVMQDLDDGVVVAFSPPRIAVRRLPIGP